MIVAAIMMIVATNRSWARKVVKKEEIEEDNFRETFKF